MALTNTAERWGLVSRTLHWLMAVILVGSLTVGLMMNDWPDEDAATKAQLFFWHQSFGLLLFVLVALRLAWRSTQPVPPVPATSSRITRRAAAVSHGLLYALMVVIPITGYLQMSATPRDEPFRAFGLVTVPTFLAPNPDTQELFRLMHEILTLVFMILIIVHVLAALKHAVVNRDGVLSRMWSGRPAA